MILPAHFKLLVRDYAKREAARRQIMAAGNQAINLAKRAIFALHRQDQALARQHLAAARQFFVRSEKLFRVWPDLVSEGPYRAALEEYAEANLYFDFLRTGKFSRLEPRCREPEIYLGGLSDATGEISRYALREATAGHDQEVERAVAAVENVIAFLYEMDLAGYLRTKFDQAKKNLRQLEQMR